MNSTNNLATARNSNSILNNANNPIQQLCFTTDTSLVCLSVINASNIVNTNNMNANNINSAINSTTNTNNNNNNNNDNAPLLTQITVSGLQAKLT